jgi:hypothetical protein
MTGYEAKPTGLGCATSLPLLPPEGKEQVDVLVWDRLADEGAVDQSQPAADPTLGGFAKVCFSKILSVTSHGISGLHCA